VHFGGGREESSAVFWDTVVKIWENVSVAQNTWKHWLKQQQLNVEATDEDVTVLSTRFNNAFIPNLLFWYIKRIKAFIRFQIITALFRSYSFIDCDAGEVLLKGVPRTNLIRSMFGSLGR